MFEVLLGSNCLDSAADMVRGRGRGARDGLGKGWREGGGQGERDRGRGGE